jgi:fructokinase
MLPFKVRRIAQMQVLGIGEVLWDLFPEEERFGGAALNFCANLQRLGNTVTLLSAVGDDPRGDRAIEKMNALGLRTRGIRRVHELPTGVAIVGRTAEGEPSFTIPRPAAFDRVSVDPEIFAEVSSGQVDWLYFGTLLQTQPSIEELTTALATSSRRLQCFYDMNLREGHWNLGLVQRLSRMASILKTNEAEAEILFRDTQPAGSSFAVEKFCSAWAAEFEIDVICVTLGPAGCCIYDRGAIAVVPGFRVDVCDTVGSGDAFAAAFLHAYDQSWPAAEAARFANALGALVASRAGATPDWSVEECVTLSLAR